MNTAIELIEDLPLTINDVARIALEITEGLGAIAAGLTRSEMMGMMRRVATEGGEGGEGGRKNSSFCGSCEGESGGAAGQKTNDAA